MNWGDDMPDYKELYLKMFRASEEAINLLIAAQRECENLYVSSSESDITIVDFTGKERQDCTVDQNTIFPKKT